MPEMTARGKQEYGDLFSDDKEWRDRVKRFSVKVQDVSQLLADFEPWRHAIRPTQGRVPRRLPPCPRSEGEAGPFPSTTLWNCSTGPRNAGRP